MKLARECRSRFWWEGIKDLFYRRSQDGLVRAGMGHRCEWEDVLCTAFGVSRCLQRDACTDYTQWRRMLPDFCHSVCEKWGLPCIGISQPASIQTLPSPPNRAKLKLRSMSDLPRERGLDCPDLGWQAGDRSFAFVVDCKPLAQVLNGHAPLK